MTLNRAQQNGSWRRYANSSQLISRRPYSLRWHRSTKLSQPSGNYPANILEGSNYFITSQTINAKFYKNLSIKYRRWLNLETADKANILISTDGGTTWTKLYENIAGMYDTYWINQSLDISNQATRKAQVSIKVGLGYTDGTGERGGWNIDNFAVTGDLLPKILASSRTMHPNRDAE